MTAGFVSQTFGENKLLKGTSSNTKTLPRTEQHKVLTKNNLLQCFPSVTTKASDRQVKTLISVFILSQRTFCSDFITLLIVIPNISCASNFSELEFRQ